MYWPENELPRLMKRSRRLKTHSMNFQVPDFRQNFQNFTLKNCWPLLQIVLRKLYIARQKIKSWHLSITLYKTQFKIAQKPYILQLLEKSIAKHFKVLVHAMIFCIRFQRTQEKFKPLERLLQHTKKVKKKKIVRFVRWNFST